MSITPIQIELLCAFVKIQLKAAGGSITITAKDLRRAMKNCKLDISDSPGDPENVVFSIPKGKRPGK